MSEIFTDELNEFVRNKLRSDGFDLTKEEVVETRKSAYDKIRTNMSKKYPWIAELDDEELFALMMELR